ncbi:PRTRC system protein E [Pedobacter insulae]|uniref:PRTRC system protein E n=1 Tax=Pedobacter insulae TaxID=414048 RepID=A0A1I2ZIP0_9SPHI|nr:PRTRC system protein E [Pedobacter insulae]SFH37436.1 PRTRC system protein E [Pedobacter insulae]
METNFFEQVAGLQLKGNLQITIGNGADDNLVVSVMLNNEQCGDDAKQLIPPLSLKGTAKDLDEGFFKQITTPLQTVSGLMVNMEVFMKQLEEVQKQSAMEKDKTDKAKKEKESRDKKYREAMSKADELEKEGKFREAWVKVPEPNLYPEYEQEIRKRRTALSAKFEPDLFAEPAKEEEMETEPQGGFDEDNETDD